VRRSFLDAWRHAGYEDRDRLVTVSPGTFLRVSAIVLLGVVLQLAVVSQIAFWGANADLTPLIVLAVGLLGGPVAGSMVGFSVGLVSDMALVQTLGVTSLLLTVLGYLVGRYGELRDSGHALVAPVAGAVATLLYATGFSIVQFLLGVESPVSALVIRDLLIGVLINGLLAMPVLAAVRALLRPSLTEPVRPRRRSSATGLRIPAA
jgi:rod shape-determining protein MreD